jgi:hypothetical protein
MQEQPAAVACLQASTLLRRRIRQNLEAGLGGEQALQGVCVLLDALSRGFGEIPATMAVERAALRLVDELQRVRTTPTDLSSTGR